MVLVVVAVLVFYLVCWILSILIRFVTHLDLLRVLLFWLTLCHICMLIKKKITTASYYKQQQHSLCCCCYLDECHLYFFWERRWPEWWWWWWWSWRQQQPNKKKECYWSSSIWWWWWWPLIRGRLVVFFLFLMVNNFCFFFYIHLSICLMSEHHQPGLCLIIFACVCRYVCVCVWHDNTRMMCVCAYTLYVFYLYSKIHVMTIRFFCFVYVFLLQ